MGVIAVQGAAEAGVAERVLANVARRGVRMTGPRRTVIRVMAEFGRPFSAPELTQVVARIDPSVGRASVYRTLSLLSETGLLRRVHGPGRERYRICPDTDHHHHVTCVRCGRARRFALAHVAAMEGPVQEAVTALEYRAVSHVLEARGLCPDCQEDRAARGTRR